jgi:hypothetical protein
LREKPFQRGFILLPVVLTLALIATLAFLMNRESGVGLELATGQARNAEARYVAEAGLHHASWLVQNGGCTGYSNLSGVSFGGHTYDVAVTPAGGSPVTIVSTGTLADGTPQTLLRTGVRVYEPAPAPLVLQPGPADGQDSYLDQWSPNTSHGSALEVQARDTSGAKPKRPILKFDLSSIPAGSQVVTATMGLYLTQSSVNPVTTSVHRVTAPWTQDSTTWNERQTGTAWASAGGDFDPTPVAPTSVGPTTGMFYDWDVTSLVAGWVNGVYPNDGLILLVPYGSSQNTFASSNSSAAAERPKLTVTYACECGGGPGNTVTLQPGPEGVDV